MDYRWLPQAPRVCHSFTSEVLQTKPPTVRMTMLTPLHQERLQDGRNQSGPRGTAMPSFGKPMKTDEHPWKHGLPCRWWVWQLLYTPCSYWWTLSSVCPSMSLSKLLSFHASLNEVCKAHSAHIVTLLNEKELHNTYWSNWNSTSLNICLKIVWKHSQKRSPEVSLGGIKTLAWSLVFLVRVCKARGQTTQRILGWNKLEHGQGLHYHELPQAPCASVAGSCSKCCKPQRSKAAYSEDDNVNVVAPETSSEVKGPEADVGGTKKRTKRNCNAIMRKTIENHGKACLAPYVVGFAAVVNYVQIEKLSVQHVQACPCQNY